MIKEEHSLINYIISCHLDKQLTQEPNKSVFDRPIQAGAALTDVRICDITDMDDCPDNISERNGRYSEATAMYWIGKHISTEYVGIMHYRRRLDLTDQKLEELMDDDVDIITTTSHDLGISMEENYRQTLFSRDFDLFMEILRSRDTANYEFYRECLSKTYIHACNVNIFRSALYREFCDWAFPVCNEFYRLSPEKTDVYQHRDVGFIMEYLSHLFVMKMEHDGYKVVEADLVNLRSDDWDPEKECDALDYNDIFNLCARLYKERQITKCNNILGVALRKGAYADTRLRTLSEIMITSQLERKELSVSMHEYLPEAFRKDPDILIDIWNGFKNIARIHFESGSDDTLEKLTEYMKLTNFSNIALREALNAAYRNN